MDVAASLSLPENKHKASILAVTHPVVVSSGVARALTIKTFVQGGARPARRPCPALLGHALGPCLQGPWSHGPGLRASFAGCYAVARTSGLGRRR